MKMSKIAINATVYSTSCSCLQQRNIKLCITRLCEGDPWVIRGFSTQRTSNVEASPCHGTSMIQYNLDHSLCCWYSVCLTICAKLTKNGIQLGLFKQRSMSLKVYSPASLLFQLHRQALKLHEYNHPGKVKIRFGKVKTMLRLIFFIYKIIRNYTNVRSQTFGSLLKWKCHHIDKIFVTECTWSCQNDNFRCCQWRKLFRYDIFLSVFIGISEHDWIVNILNGRQSWREIMDLFMMSGLLWPEVFVSEHWARVADYINSTRIQFGC